MATLTTSSSKGNQLSTTMHEKFEGFIELDYADHLRSSIINLFTYLDSESLNIGFFYTIITFIRCMQIIGPSLMANLDILWKNDTSAAQTIIAFSVFYQILPKSVLEGYEEIMIFLLAAIQIIFFILICGAAIYYKTTATINVVVGFLIKIYMDLFVFVLPTMTMNYAGLLISSMIVGKRALDLKNCLAIVIGLVAVIMYLWFLLSCYNMTLSFRRSSFQTIESSSQNTIFMTTIAINFLLALLSKLSTIPLTVIGVISIFVYVYLAYKTIHGSTIIKEIDQIIVLSSSIISIITIIGAIISINLGKHWDEMVLLLLCIVIIISYSVSYAITRRINIRSIGILDLYEDTKDINAIGTPSKFLSILASGFNYCHPICLDLSLFSNVVEVWPHELVVWITFAKFAAIYPENESTLEFIIKSFTNSGNKGLKADAIISCINNILKIRETNLSPFLKGKLEKLKRVNTKTKNKLRNVWDLVLQCNIKELDAAIHAAYECTEANEQDIKHLLNMFPNNRFVARTYASFFLDIKADLENHTKWRDNLHKLQRGSLINEDQIQKLGLEAFNSLPLSLDSSHSNHLIAAHNSEENSEEFVLEDNENANNRVLTAIIKKKRFNSTNFIYLSTILSFIFFITVPSIFFILIFPLIREKLIEPLNYMYGVSYLRNILNMITAFTVDILATNVENPKTPGITIMEKMSIPPSFPMDAFGGFYDCVNMTNFLISEVSTISDLIYGITNFKKGDADLDLTRSLLFENNINFTSYTANGTKVTSLVSIETVVTKVAHSASIVAGMDNFTKDSFFTPAAKSATTNNDDATITMNHALLLLTQYVKDEDKRNQKIFTIVCIVFCIFSSVSYFVIYILQLRLLTNQKLEIFKTLTILPKTVISNISASLCSIKNEKFNSSSTNNEDSSIEMNKQEENVIKVFNSISENDAYASSLLAGIMFIILIISSIISLYFITSTYRNVSTTIIVSCPHINNLLGSSSYLFSILSKLFRISISKEVPDLEGIVESIKDEVEDSKRKLASQNKYFNSLRFGGTGSRDYPFTGIDNSLTHATVMVVCNDPYVPPTNFLEGGICFDAEGLVYLTTAFIKKYVHSMEKNHFVKPRSENLAYVWQLGAVMQYQAFFFPSSNKIINTILRDLDNEVPKMYIAAGVCITISFIVSLFIIFFAKKEEKYMRYALGIFLHAPTKTIYALPKVMEIICGDDQNSLFEDSTERDSDFYSNVISKLNDIVVIAGSDDDTIIEINIAFENTFGVKEEEIVGTKLMDFIVNSNFEGASPEEILSKRCDVVYNNNGTNIYLEFRPLNVNRTRAIIGRNQTTRVLHDRLMHEEKQKSDSMLSSILPASLVPRVQSGEKNISFAVQSVSVLFLDIVEFTPWCGSNKAEYVMKTLNHIFKEFDALIATHKTLSKIKCIGDCYMAAGGIFDEVNQPAVHTKEMVEFGIESIKKIREIDEIYNEKLRIRVGINTGGPIIAGVIGTGKPTFEILGPTINIAQQMEHHGVAMKVHISRSVYELVYGGNFIIKERGEIEVKNGKMFTYLVDADK